MIKVRKNVFLAMIPILLVLSWSQSGSAAQEATPAKTSDSDKLDKMFELMKSFDSRIKNLEEKKSVTTESEKKADKAKPKSKTVPAKKVVSGKSYDSGWIVKVYKHNIKGASSALGNRVGAFIAKSLPINAKDHEAKSKVAGETGYKISGYLKISHSAETILGLRLFSKADKYNRSSALCYRVSLSLEGSDIISEKGIKPGLIGAPNILTGVVNLQPGNYKIDIEYTCIGGGYSTQNHFDITYLTDDMLNAKVISSDMMLRKAAKK